MAYDHISTNIEKYSIFFDNKDTEDKLQDDDLSSASSFTVLLDPQVDLSPLLYLRAVEAELGVRNVIIDSLPLCFIRQETIEIHMESPLESVDCNWLHNRSALERLNAIPLQLELTDLSCSDPQVAVDYLNDIMGYSLNQHLLHHYLFTCFDCDIFKPEYLRVMSKHDVKLLEYYLNFALLARREIHNVLCKHIGIAGDDLTTLTKPSTVRPAVFLEKDEDTLIRGSACLLQVKDRKVPRGKKGTNMDLTLFYGVDPKKPSIALDNAIITIHERTETWLRELDLLETVSPLDTSLLEDSLKTLKELYTSNKALILHALRARSILAAQADGVPTKRKRDTDLFQNSLLVLGLDDARMKCRFHFHPYLFIPGDKTTVTIYFPPRVSYTLGSRNDENIVIGPLTADTPITGTPRLAVNLMHTNQLLPSSICTMPRTLYIATDIIASKSRDMWLRSSPFADYHLIFNLTIDDQVVNDRMISHSLDVPVFHKIQRINNVLEKFSVRVLDHNLRLCMFSQRTYTRIALLIRPVALDK